MQCVSFQNKRRLSSNSSLNSTSQLNKKQRESSELSENSHNLSYQGQSMADPVLNQSLHGSQNLSPDLQGPTQMPRFAVNQVYQAPPPTMHSTPIPAYAQMPQQQSLLTDYDIQQIAYAVHKLIANDVKQQTESMVAPFIEGYNSMAQEIKTLKNRVDELEQYGRKNCVRIFGVPEDKVDTDKAVLEISEKLDIPIQQSDIAVSHRVGPTKSGKPRPIIARITNYSLRHRLLKESKKLHKVEGMSRVSVNQDLTKRRAKLAYESRQLVKKGQAKSTFVFDGKIFLVDHSDKKIPIKCLDDLFPFGYTPPVPTEEPSRSDISAT
ncbi:hypothetical protein FSP39_019362 [Pinctada imbricata]|uniref:Uncharacterized protein n=1 Tax=Pinctada imbricata TaxID=66713 RepID=A0AA88Y0W3_PINIB|nr:hypothetical protein FSP39_019362 [Pinctada imbricata]